MGAGEIMKLHVVVLVGVLFAAVVIPAVAGAQSGSTLPPEAGAISVTPNVDLVDGQTITVTGTGWPAHGTVNLVQCEGAEDHCTGPDGSAPTDGAGSFSTTMRVRAVFADYDGTVVDCRLSPCALRLDIGVRHAAASLSFDPVAPLLPSPTVVVAPDVDLIDGQDVAVSGTGFFPDEFVHLAECPAGASAFQQCAVLAHGGDITDPSGNFSTTVEVVARFQSFFTPVDCRQTACVLVAGPLPPPSLDAEAALTFDPDGPLLPPPPVGTATASPTTGLVDGQVIEVEGTGYAPGRDGLLLQCVDDGDGSSTGCDADNGQTAFHADSSGAFHATFQVHTTFERFDGGQADCLVDPCKLAVFDPVQGPPPVWIPLSFVATPAPSASPVAVEPRFTG